MDKRTIYLIAAVEALVVLAFCIGASFAVRGGISLGKEGVRFVKELRQGEKK